MYQAIGIGTLEIRTCKACCRDETGAVCRERPWGGGTGLPRALGAEPCPALRRIWLLLCLRVLKIAYTLLYSALLLLLDLKCLKTMPICSYPQQAKGMMVEAKRNSMPCHFNSSNISPPPPPCRIFMRKQWPSLMPCIQTPHCFYLCDFFALGYRSNKFPGKWNSLIRLPSIKFHIRNEKISLTELNIAVNQYM